MGTIIRVVGREKLGKGEVGSRQKEVREHWSGEEVGRADTELGVHECTQVRGASGEWRSWI